MVSQRIDHFSHREVADEHVVVHHEQDRFGNAQKFEKVTAKIVFGHKPHRRVFPNEHIVEGLVFRRGAIQNLCLATIRVLAAREEGTQRAVQLKGAVFGEYDYGDLRKWGSRSDFASLACSISPWRVLAG